MSALAWPSPEKPVSARARLSPEDEAGPPRHNGELVFEAPWESQVFGLAVAMADQGIFEWAAFRQKLVEETALDDAAERAGRQPRPYYLRWERALERLLVDLGLAGAEELDAAEELEPDTH